MNPLYLDQLPAIEVLADANLLVSQQGANTTGTFTLAQLKAYLFNGLPATFNGGVTLASINPASPATPIALTTTSGSLVLSNATYNPSDLTTLVGVLQLPDPTTMAGKGFKVFNDLDTAHSYGVNIVISDNSARIRYKGAMVSSIKALAEMTEIISDGVQWNVLQMTRSGAV